MTRALGWVVALALGLGAGCDAADPPGAAHSAAAAGFDGARAFRDLADQVRLGPRHPGSPGSLAVRELIHSRLRQAGWVVRDHAFEAGLPDASRIGLVNVIGSLPGPGDGTLMLASHYDTKRLPEVPEFAGANDGASGVAVLLELARVLPKRSRALDYELVFFDGEEAVGPQIVESDGLYGSRAFVRELQGAGRLSGIRALVLVDMVGDADLDLAWSTDSSPALVGPWLELARAAGVALSGPMAFVDDHTPFVEAGLPHVLALIDFRYGGRASPGWRWHTAGDRLEAVSADSLDRVGKLLLEWLARVEPQLAHGAGANPER